jgi:Flp pilus assembly protein TadB
MGRLEYFVRRGVEEEALKDFLEGEYETTDREEKERLLNKLRQRGDIDREVNATIKDFQSRVTEVNEKAENRKRTIKKIKNSAFAILNGILTTLIAFAVNKEVWPFIWGLVALFVVLQIVFIFWIDE